MEKQMNERKEQYEHLLSQAIAYGKQVVVNAIIFNERREILLLRRAAERVFLPQAWDLPGGHVKQDESLFKALGREIHEETGWILCSIDKLVLSWDWERTTSRGALQRKRQFDFVVSVERRKPYPVYDVREFSGYRWLAESETSLLMENRDSKDTWLYEVVTNAFEWRRANG